MISKFKVGDKVILNEEYAYRYTIMSVLRELGSGNVFTI